ncbi:sulfotransferase family 2 domain-containing protein [Halovulum sp. GXIMD14793]
MTNILATSPDAVLIHIPKTGFTSLRSFWDLGKAPRAFGFVPDTWPASPRIAAIRHPESRFLSAIRMFKYGNPGFDDHYQHPVLPDLTIAQALDILQDDSIAFDRTVRDHIAALKHHLLPQTHPFNCLAKADTILRFETLDEDFKALRPKLGLKGDLPHLRANARPNTALTFSKEERALFEHIFAEDFRQLGYAPGDGKLQLAPAPQSTIWATWPALFDSRHYPAGRASEALPAPDRNLDIFLTESVPGPSGPTWPQRRPNLRKHFLRLQPEFAGKPRLAHLFACTIVTIRRSNGTAGLDLFFRIAEDYHPQMQHDLNARWLVAVCDTFADHGRTPQQRAIGLAGSMLMNAVKLFETERHQYHPKRPWPPKSRIPGEAHLFDGLLAYWTKKGDLVDNMRKRVTDIAALDPIAGPYLVEIMQRVETNDTSFQRLAQLTGDDPRPRTRKWPLRVIEALGRRYL